MSMLMVVLSWGLWLGSAQAWWNEQWTHRKKIVLDASPSGADIKQNLAEFPVLIRLHSGNFDFTKVMEGGEDIRFVSADDQTLLKHHIESYDSFDEIGLVWVKLPAVTAGSNQGSIWMYYGNTAAASGSDKVNTFDTQYRNVLHFSELEGLPQDASSYTTHPAEYTAGLGMPGAIGNGATFSGAGNLLRLSDHPALDFSNGLTLSTWIKINNPQSDAVLFTRGGENAGITLSIQDTRVVVRMTQGENIYESAGSTDLPLEGWHHLALTLAPQGPATLYLDGVETETVDTPMDLSSLLGDILVGADAEGNRSLTGELDEFRISAAARSGDWIRASQASQGPNARFSAILTEEAGEAPSGMPVFYLATIFQHITLDGMVVIGLLIFMGIMCWIVMIMKGMFLWNRSKGNKQFMAAYTLAPDPVSLAAKQEDYNGSGLYEIFQTGCGSLTLEEPDPETGQPSEKKLSSKALESFKAVLEKGLSDEMKRLNSQMTILVMSISGGPFLGLLGTVWGVMNTFAAMAEAGEANIMAIAPGVASALATTVFGLIVAIPALFGYSFLAGQIRNITTESGLFVDQFALRVDAVYGEEK